MKNQELRMQQALLLAKTSKCVKMGVGAIICDENGDLLSEGYNGMFKGGENTCGDGGGCKRLTIASGSMNEVGCIHAEMNAIFHCARLGRSTRGATLVSSVQPCLGCAKAIVASGIKKVITRETGYVGEGVELLRAEGVTVEFLGTVESIQPPMERKASCFAVGYGC